MLLRLATRASLLIGVITVPALAADSAAPQFLIKSSGFSNFSSRVSRHGPAAFGEAEIELSPQYKLSPKVTLAARVAVNARDRLARTSSGLSLAVPEASVFAIGPFGRIEIGRRAGFPQSLVGFTPSEIAFTASEYGPESGARLDPDGGLASAYLSPEVRDPVQRLSYRGYAALLYDDRSTKIIYLSPRSKAGVYGAVYFTPRTEAPDRLRLAGRRQPGGERFRDVVQAALVWNHRSETVDLSVGATLSHASPIPSPSATVRQRKTTSLSGGVSATIRDRWALGLSGTWDGLSAPAPGAREARGTVASINYVAGPWIAGGYVQHAEAPSLTRVGVRDRLKVAQVGLSYFADHDHDLLGAGAYTDVKLFTSVTATSLRTDSAPEIIRRRRAVVLLAGARFAFF